jgi:hypothetical protein
MDEISDDEILYRCLFPYYVKDDGTVSSSAYMQSKPKIPDPEISVDLASLTTPERTLVGHSGFALGALKAGEIRKLGFTVRRDPTPDNQAHCIIEGVKTKEDCKHLAEITSALPLSELLEPGA